MTCPRNNLGTIFLLAVLLMTAGLASAQCTNPATSRFPTHIVVCPRGDLPVSGTANDVNGNPCGGVLIGMAFNTPAVNTLWHAPGSSFPTYANTTRPNGDVVFWPQVGGCELQGSALFIEPVASATLSIAGTIVSPDLDGDGHVGLSDLTIFSAAYTGPYNRCADFDGNGSVDLADLVLFSAHYGH